MTTTTEAKPTTTTTRPGYVTEAEYGDDWPLTVPAGQLACVGASEVIFTAEGTTYAINGSARGVREARGWSEIDPIWRDNPDIPGTKINIGPLIDRGLELC